METFTRACAACALAFSAMAFAQTADIILVNGKIVSADENAAVHEALAVRDGRIVALGRDAEVRKQAAAGTRVIDLGGRTVIPGLIDSHIHAIRAALSYATEVHWFGASSVEEAVGRVREAARKAKPGEWLVVAGGWTEEQFRDRRRPTQAELVAAAPDNPVYVQWMYGWAMLTPPAQKALGINSEADLPGGGKFERDPAGNLTGAVVGGIVPLFDKLPRPTHAQKIEGTKKFFRELNRVGLTGFIDPGGFNMSPEEYAPLLEVWRHRQLTVRVVYSYFAQKRGKELEEFRELTQLLPMGFGDDLLRFNGIGERVTFGMYNNDQPTAADKEQFYQVARWAAERGMSLTQHWHSDASMHHLLEVFDRVNREFPIAKMRWSVAHLNNASEATLARMKALGVGWLMQDAMYFDGERELKARGEAELKRMPPMRTALKVGTAIGAGTDEHRRGALAVGKLADLVVLDRDYLTVPVQEIGALHSLLTMVGGRVVYAEGDFRNFEQQR
jgi:predicted amidohydrolase YtcJ